jgi:hypothetical protein
MRWSNSPATPCHLVCPQMCPPLCAESCFVHAVCVRRIGRIPPFSSSSQRLYGFAKPPCGVNPCRCSDLIPPPREFTTFVPRTEWKFALFQCLVRSVPKPPSQQLWKESGQRERKRPFVSPLKVNSFIAKLAPNLGFSNPPQAAGENFLLGSLAEGE